MTVLSGISDTSDIIVTMKDLVDTFVDHVKTTSSNPEFIHHKWFVEYHLEIVEKISLELCDIYEQADKEFVRLLAWLHDYGKTLDFDNQYEKTLVEGRKKLTEIGFPRQIVDRAINAMEIIDRKDWDELERAPIEIKIVSSADAASHHTGPFFALWWYENANKDFKELMQDNVKKSDKDWHRKMILPEVREAFESRRKLILELNGHLPDSYVTNR